MSISLWIRIASPQTRYQTIFGSGRTNSDTGVLLRVRKSATVIFARSIHSSQHLLTPDAQLPDKLQAWTHVVLTIDWTCELIFVFSEADILIKFFLDFSPLPTCSIFFFVFLLPSF